MAAANPLSGNWKNEKDTNKCYCFLDGPDNYKKSYIQFIWDKYPNLDKLTCQCQDLSCKRSVKRSDDFKMRQKMHGAHVVNEKCDVIIIPLFETHNNARKNFPPIQLPADAPYVVLECCCHQIVGRFMRAMNCNCNGRNRCWCLQNGTYPYSCTC